MFHLWGLDSLLEDIVSPSGCYPFLDPLRGPLSELLFPRAGLPWSLGLEGKTQTMSQAAQAPHSRLQPLGTELEGSQWPLLLCHCPVLPCHPGPVEDAAQPRRPEGSSPGLRWSKMGWSTLRNGRSPSLGGGSQYGTTLGVWEGSGGNGVR